MKFIFPVVYLLCCVSSTISLTFTPTSYDISLDFSTFSSDNKVFDGKTSIYFIVPERLYGVQVLELDSELLTINNVTVVDTNHNAIEVIKSSYNENKYSIEMNLVNDTSELLVILSYKGTIGHAGDTGVFVADDQNVIATNSYPEGVRKIFPCINDPSIRTTFTLDVKLVNKEWGIHHLSEDEQSPLLPANAVGFIMTLRYRKVDDVSNERFNVWVPSYNQPLYDSVNTNKILKDALASGTYFYKFFDLTHLDRIHIVMVPGIDLLSVISHRLICMRPDVLISSENETAEMKKATAVATLNALSKHFFRCVVSPKTWEDFWLSDSLALYLQYALMNNEIFHEENFPDLFTLELQRPAMREAQLPVKPKNVDPKILITGEVYPPSYQGAAILKMLEPLSSREGIVQDLFNYYRNFMYKSVETQEFLNFMSTGSMFNALIIYGQKLDLVLKKWIHDIGYPYLTDVTLSENGFTLSQKKYYGSNSTSKWIIPFVYSDNSNINGTLDWLNSNTIDVYRNSDNVQWIQLNKQSKGMFRVNYGDLLEEMSKDTIYWNLSDVDRAALIDDTYHLSWRAEPIVNFGYSLNLFGKLAHETDYVPLSLSMYQINTLRHFYTQMGLGSLYESKIADIIKPLYSSVDWLKTMKVNLGKDMWSRTVVQTACKYFLSNCLFEAAKYYNDKSSILNDLLPTINCQQIRDSDQTKWEDNFKKYYNKNDTQYARADALYSLACPKNQEGNNSVAINYYLDSINSDSILMEDAQRAFSYIYSMPEHINQTVNYINNNYMSLWSRFGDSFMAGLITEIYKLLLPNYYNDILKNIKNNTPNHSATMESIIKIEEDMPMKQSIVNSNLYEMRKWLSMNFTNFKSISLLEPTFISDLSTPSIIATEAKSAVSHLYPNILFIVTLCFLVSTLLKLEITQI